MIGENLNKAATDMTKMKLNIVFSELDLIPAFFPGLMKNVMKKDRAEFFVLGLIFTAIGFVQQEFSFSFESDFFNLGIIFALSGVAASALKST